MGGKNQGPIQIGPLADGNVYTYEPGSGKWFDGEEEAVLIPYEWQPGGERKGLYYFHTERREWLDEHYMELPTDMTDRIQLSFRKEYGLDRDIRLFAFDKGHDKTNNSNARKRLNDIDMPLILKKPPGNDGKSGKPGIPDRNEDYFPFEDESAELLDFVEELV